MERTPRRQIAVLRLDRSVSVEGDPNSDLNHGSYSDVERIQLVTLNRQPFSPYAGKRVEVVGTLFEKITGHHYTDVLIIVRQIEVRPR
jgi:hypothetical protein